MKITSIKTRRLRHELSPPFNAAWDLEPRKSFEATLFAVETDESVTGVGSGASMDGFSGYEHLFIGEDPTRIAHPGRVRWRPSTSTPGATGRSKPRCGTSTARSAASR